MQSVLIVVHLIIVLALVGVVLIQRSEGGGLGIGGGGSGSGFMTGRGQANVLTRMTGILAALFFLTSLGLTFIAARQTGPASIFDNVAPGGAAAPAGEQGDIFQQLQRLQGDTPAPAPAAPNASQAPDASLAPGAAPSAPATGGAQAPQTPDASQAPAAPQAPAAQ